MNRRIKPLAISTRTSALERNTKLAAWHLRKTPPSQGAEPSDMGSPVWHYFGICHLTKSPARKVLGFSDWHTMDFIEDQQTAVSTCAGADSGVLVSVVIPTYNAAPYIADTLDSVFAQTFRNFEVIVVNDGSPDTAALEQALQPYLSRIRYLKQENRGPSAARNRAIRQGRGKYVAFLDSDDLWLPMHLGRQLESLARGPDLGLVYANGVHFEENVPLGTAFASVPQSEQVTLESLLAEQCTINTSSVVASREAMLRVGLFDENMNRCEDFDLWLRLSYDGVRMSYDREVQVCHRLGRGLSADRELMKRGRLEVYKKIAANGLLTQAQRSIIAAKLKTLEVEIQVELTKQALLAGKFREALSAAECANSHTHAIKLGVAELGLRCFPGLMRWLYRIYVRVLGLYRRSRRVRSTRIDVQGKPVDFEMLIRRRPVR